MKLIARVSMTQCTGRDVIKQQSENSKLYWTML